MPLLLSKNATLTELVSEANPITTDHPTTGSTAEVRLWLYNNNAAKKYTSVIIDPIDAVAPDDSTWVQLALDNNGLPGSYLAGGAALTMADINDANVGHPFWIRVTTPDVSDSQNKTDIRLEVSGREWAL